MSTLYDPASSQFEDVAHFPSTGAVCGRVNAKNRMGGYVGFTRFVITTSGEVVVDPNADTRSGDAQEQLAALDRQLIFLKKMQAECPQATK